MPRIARLSLACATAAMLGSVSVALTPAGTVSAAFVGGSGGGTAFFSTDDLGPPAPSADVSTAVSPPPVPACAQPNFITSPYGTIVVDTMQFVGQLELHGTTQVSTCTVTDESGTISFSFDGWDIPASQHAVACSTFAGSYVRRGVALQVNAQTAGCTVYGIATGPIFVQLTGVVEYQATNGACCPVFTDYQAAYLVHQ